MWMTSRLQLAGLFLPLLLQLHIWTVLAGVVPNTNLDSVEPRGDVVANAEEGPVFNTTRPRPELRILSLGASIIWGLESSNGNGFRGPLRERLVREGWNVHMVGTRRNGVMIDNAVEANPGDPVDVIHKKLRHSFIFKPNVVLLNGGTNDAHREIDVEHVGARMDNLLRDLWAAPGMNTTLVVLTTLLPTIWEPELHNRIPINEQLRALVARLQKDEGRPILLADMAVDLTLDDLGHDGAHPSDPGYAKMGDLFIDKIYQGFEMGMLTDPAFAYRLPR